ncbi:PREDICTED: sterol regulatory element-binding protein cleavage-activating protein isoform X2 [Nicrophorus vespilloides]|uniref:Sterol regulatory element-binding protein cleavage-activating protein n=1 Tax=Nicrophorus vespilloides TaxID=110193 RepID=A0ABM1MT23_NICVS|nr:PREDICTED: sterol regulatory element-binding protein cleavage-activating protein isoform X2 [Nicrophorus vespilloides]
MNTRVEEAPRGRGAKATALQNRVAQLYYSHGLFCSSYPTTVISIAIIVAIICCYPLLNLPLSGNLPVHISNNGSAISGGVPIVDAPKCYVQQVVLRSAVVPWTDSLAIGDAFRAPLYEAFKLLDVVRNYQDPNSLKTLGHVCLHVESIKKKVQDSKNNVFPEYSCLVLSPANMWKQDVQLFAQDTSILNTIFNHQNLQKGKTSVAEMLFGMHLVDTGIKRYPLRNRQRVLQYAVTLFFKEYDEQFIAGLRHKLQTLYPLHQELNQTHYEQPSYLNDTVLIHYPGEINYFEYVPLIITYMLLFFYYYFSVRKIELINSKIGMAFTVVLTVLCSLSMTLGVCFFFGLTLNMQDKQIFPYLVILVGLENVLVLTKSIVSTPSHLDIKIRVARGLSKEGWSITKNLLIEITILTIGLFTFFPAIQEFCIFAIVGLIVDFFLQMFFFTTVLGIDTRHIEKTDKNNLNFRNNLYRTSSSEKINSAGMNRSKSHPRLNSIHTNVVAGQTQGKQEKKIPKRLRLVNIWARTRFFQRAFMILMVIWIGMILYNSGIMEQYFLDLYNITEKGDGKNKSESNVKFNILPILNSNETYMVNFVTQKSTELNFNNTDEINKLKHGEYVPWMRLSTQHWPSILRKYNVSLTRGHIAVLPNIKISHAVAPEQAVLLRNADEKYGRKFEWHALALALDPIDFSDSEGTSSSQHFPQSDRPFYPTSPMEIFLTAILCAISVFVLAYAVFVLYKCICSRNYAEWRASWTSDKSGDESDIPVLLEAVPVVLDGHTQEIECIATDGFSIVSTCLGGHLKVWDANTGELITNIIRRQLIDTLNQSDSNLDCDENGHSDYESGSPPSRDENFMSFPSLRNKINTNFSNFTLEPVTNTGDSYDFGDQYRELYANHSNKLKQRHYDGTGWLQCERNYSEPENFSDRYTGANRSSAIDIRNSRHYSKDYMASMNSPKSVNGVSHNVCDYKVPPIWCIDFVDNLIVIGCANGRVEFWEGTTAKFKCLFDDESGIGITAIKLVGSRVIAARLYGSLDFLQLQTYSQGKQIDWNFTSAYRRTHVRTGSAGSISDYSYLKNEEAREDMRCVKMLSAKAHQQPITCLDCEGGKVVTGSQDHTLKVFRLEDGKHLYTLHGHSGPISCLFIDRISPATSGSGSQDGMLCVWDLLTGACMYSIQAHDGQINSLTYSASYVISLGADERICVWERFQGHLLNTIHVNGTHTSQVLMLTPHLVVTARAGGLSLWDVHSGDSVRSIVLGHAPFIFVSQLVTLRDAVLCDFGKELMIVRFPLITHKYD